MARLINRLQLKPSKSSRQTVGQTLEPWFTVLNGFWTGFQVWPDIDRVSIRFYWVFTEFVDGKRGGAEDQRDEGDDFAPDDRRGHQRAGGRFLSGRPSPSIEGRRRRRRRRQLPADTPAAHQVRSAFGHQLHGRSLEPF